MENVYPDYAAQVAFYAVGLPGESLQKLDNYRQQEGYPWPVAEPVGGMLKDLRIVVQSTKIAFDSNGVITYRDGYGRGDPGTWREVFEQLAESGNQ